MDISKLTSTAKKLDTFFRVLRRIILVCIIVTLCVLTVLTVVNAVNADAVIGDSLNMIDLGPVTVELAEEHTPSNGAILGYCWIYAAVAAACGAAIYAALGIIRKILHPMTEGQPFCSETANELKKLAVISLIYGVIENIGSAAETIFAVRIFGIDSIAGTGMIRSVTANYSFDLTFIVVFFVLMLMSYIFSYGSQLQNLSDETL